MLSLQRHRIKQNEILLIIPLIFSLIIMAQCSKSGEKLKPEGIWLVNDKEYETDVGALKGGFLLQNGNKMNNGKIEIGAIYMDSKKAVEISKNMAVKKTNQKLDVEVIILQDKKTGGWLASQGWLGIESGEYFFLENTRIKVVGGNSDPILINGKPYANTELVARK